MEYDSFCLDKASNEELSLDLQITHTGPPSESRQQESRARKYAPIIQDKSELWLNKRQNLIFSGFSFITFQPQNSQSDSAS